MKKITTLHEKETTLKKEDEGGRLHQSRQEESTCKVSTNISIFDNLGGHKKW